MRSMAGTAETAVLPGTASLAPQRRNGKAGRMNIKGKVFGSQQGRQQDFTCPAKGANRPSRRKARAYNSTSSSLSDPILYVGRHSHGIPEGSNQIESIPARSAPGISLYGSSPIITAAPEIGRAHV